MQESRGRAVCALSAIECVQCAFCSLCHTHEKTYTLTHTHSHTHTHTHTHTHAHTRTHTHTHKHTRWTKNYTGDYADLALNFVVTENVLGETVSTDLVPGGRDMPVTANNIVQYKALISD
jgi:ABC-type Zn2+ transport system substrate-binding protein/surface adhesin